MRDMSYIIPYAPSASYSDCTMYSNPVGPSALRQDIRHYPLPFYSHLNEPFHLTWRYFGGLHETARHVEYHHYYGPNSSFLSSPSWHYQRQHMWPAVVSTGHAPAQPLPQSNDRWPEGATLKVQLQWGELERVYGPRRDLPNFVREDLRRVYGTYPRTHVSIAYRGGVYVVRGDPHVGNQEYRVEKKVVRQLESPHGESMSDTVERRKIKKK